jgi:hypothetical protein
MAKSKADFFAEGRASYNHPLRVNGTVTDTTMPLFGLGDSWQAKAFAEGWKAAHAETKGEETPQASPQATNSPTPQGETIQVPTTKGNTPVEVLAEYNWPVNGSTIRFVLHIEPSGQDRLTVSEYRTGFGLGNIRGKWDLFRRLSDGYSKRDLARFCEGLVWENIHRHGTDKIVQALASKPTINSQGV